MKTLPMVKLENFEGPFDLVLELARERRLDITTLNLRQITDDFLQYVRAGNCTPEMLGDFLVVAATLLLLKVRELLPRLAPEEEAEVAMLTERIETYRPFREAADALRNMWGKRVLLSAGTFRAENHPTSRRFPASIVDMGILVNAFRGFLTKLPKPTSVRAHLRPRGKSLAEWLTVFAERIRQIEQLVFQKTVAGGSRQDVAISFLAVLELARKQEAVLSQEGLHQDLIVRRP